MTERDDGQHESDASATEDGGDGDGDAEARSRRRRRLVLLVSPIVALTIVGTVANAFTPVLAARHPLLLISLDARNRQLVLARHVDLLPFLLVATLRRALSDPLFYLLGRSYGDAAVRWLEKKGGGGEIVRLIERLFAKASYPMVFLFPGAVVCALAGQTGMAPRIFLPLNIIGTICVVLSVRAFSDAIASPVEAVLGFFNRNLVLTTSISVGLVVLWLVTERLQRKFEAGSVEALEKEIESPSSEPEEGVEADRDAGPAGDGLHGQQDSGHER